MPRLNWTFLGETPYLQALRLQYKLAGKVAQGADPVLLLLEHPPSITLGRQADPDNLNLSETEYKKRGIGVFNVLRGGDVTLHCRGQLVGYPIANLRQLKYSVPAWVRCQAGIIERFLFKHEIAAAWSDVHPGVWINDKKIAALGFHISRGISTHGFIVHVHQMGYREEMCFITRLPEPLVPSICSPQRRIRHGGHPEFPLRITMA